MDNYEHTLYATQSLNLICITYLFSQRCLEPQHVGSKNHILWILSSFSDVPIWTN